MHETIENLLIVRQVHYLLVQAAWHSVEVANELEIADIEGHELLA